MDNLLSWSFILSMLAALVAKVQATCTYPAVLANSTPISDTVKASYLTDEIVLYQCLVAEGGQGYIFAKCLGDSTWSPPERKCTDHIFFDYRGSLSGILLASFAIILTVSCIIYSQVKFKPKQTFSDSVGDVSLSDSSSK